MGRKRHSEYGKEEARLILKCKIENWAWRCEVDVSLEMQRMYVTELNMEHWYLLVQNLLELMFIWFGTTGEDCGGLWPSWGRRGLHIQLNAPFALPPRKDALHPLNRWPVGPQPDRTFRKEPTLFPAWIPTACHRVTVPAELSRLT